METKTMQLPSGISYSMNDFVNPDDLGIWKHCYALLDHGFLLAIVFADCEQDALDEAFDHGKLEQFRITEEEAKDYGPDGWGISYLGNEGTECDIESVEIVELPMPKKILVF